MSLKSLLLGLILSPILWIGYSVYLGGEYYRPANSLKLFANLEAQITNFPVFVGGEDSVGKPHYRIPALAITPKGTLLAFAEGRDTSADSGTPNANISLVLKRSLNGGKTWEEEQTLHADPAFDYADPSPLVDVETGDIYIFYAQFPDDCAFNGDCVNQTHDNHIFYRKSADEGATWAPAVKLTSAKDPTWRAIKVGPGVGRQLAYQTDQNGRLIIPLVYRDATSRTFSRSLYSDDAGATWQKGEAAPFNSIGESDLVELTNGHLFMSSRHIKDSDESKNLLPESRVYFRSQDAGETWQPTASYGLQTTRVDIALETISHGDQEVILATAPLGMASDAIRNTALQIVADGLGERGIENSINRFNLGLWQSHDGGLTFIKPRKLFDGFSAYSSMQVHDDHLYVLFEESPSEAISLLKVSTTNLQL